MNNYGSNQVSTHVQELIRQLYLKGRSINQIARELMLARTTVHKYLREMELIEVPPEAKKHGAKRFSPEEIAEMVAHYQEGKSIDGITEAYGITRSSLYNQIQRAGIAKRSQQRGRLQRALRLYESGGWTVKRILEETGVPRTTFYRHVDRLELEKRNKEWGSSDK